MLGSVSSHVAAAALVVAGFAVARSAAAPLRVARSLYDNNLFRNGMAVWPISSGIGGVRSAVKCGSSELSPKIGDCTKLINGHAVQGWGDEMYVKKGEEVWYTFGHTVELNSLWIDQRGWSFVSNCDDNCRTQYSASASGTFQVLTLDPATRTWVTLKNYINENAALKGTKDYGLIQSDFPSVLSNGIKIVSNGGDPEDTNPDYMQIAEIYAFGNFGPPALAFECSESTNFITGVAYSQQAVCGSVAEVLKNCEAECDRIGCTAFFYQEHPNNVGCPRSPLGGYQICGYTTSGDYGTTRHSWHREGSQVCRNLALA